MSPPNPRRLTMMVNSWSRTRMVTVKIFIKSGETPVSKRFIQLSEVSEVLDISSAQAYALVRSGELPAIKVGGRGQWRVEVTELETYIQRMYSETKTFVAAHPFGQGAE